MVLPSKSYSQVFAVPLGMGDASLDSKTALIILLAFPTVWTCSVVLTFTGQFAVNHTHTQWHGIVAPRQRERQEFIVKSN